MPFYKIEEQFQVYIEKIVVKLIAIYCFNPQKKKTHYFKLFSFEIIITLS